MTVSEKSHEYLSDYIQFSFKKRFKLNKNRFISKNAKFQERKVNSSYEHQMMTSAFLDLVDKFGL